jgi:hypothetical protein
MGEWGGLNTRLNDAAILVAGVAYQRIPTHHVVIVGRKVRGVSKLRLGKMANVNSFGHQNAGGELMQM